MVIFSYFAGFVIIGIIIRLVILFIPGNGNGEDKIAKIIAMFLSLLLVSVAWACIYAFFEYEAKNGFAKAPTPIGKNQQSTPSGQNNNNNNGNVVKFEDKK